MRIFKNTWFDRFAGKENIADGELMDAANLLENSQADANLGGGVYKMRIARRGGGKSGGYRAIVFFRSGERTFFVYCFAKSDRGNISENELRNMKKQARSLFSMSDAQIEAALEEGTLMEIRGERSSGR